MRLKALAAATAATGLLALTAAIPVAQAQPDHGNAWAYQNGQWVWSPQLNVQKSEHYHALLQHNRGFREARLRKECGPIADPQLHQQCLQSFAGYSPYGTSTPTYATIGGGYYGSSAAPSYPTGGGR